MKKIIVIIFVILFKVSFLSPNNFNEVPTLKGTWVYKPSNFKFINDKQNHGFEREWKCTKVLLFENYYAYVGQVIFKNKKEGQPYYCVEIEELHKNKHFVITQLSFALNYVSKDKITEHAKKIVKFNKKENIVIFDLGKNKFKCKLEKVTPI